MEEGKLAKWLVKEGQQVKAGDIIAEIETDKATMEVEAVDEGKVGKLLVVGGHRRREGQHADRDAAGGWRERECSAGGEGCLRRQRRKVRRRRSSGSDARGASAPGHVIVRPIGQGRSARRGGRDRRARPAATAAAERQRSAFSPRRWRGGWRSRRGVEMAALRRLGSAWARRQARRRDGGRRTEAQLRAAQGRNGGDGESRSAGVLRRCKHARRQDPRAVRQGSYEVIPHDNMRRVIAQRLTLSKQTIPHF